MAPPGVAPAGRMARAARAVERVNMWIARSGAILFVALSLLVIVDVVGRQIFIISSIRSQELEWYLHTVMFCCLVAATYDQDRHVRVDIFRVHWSDKTRDRVEVAGIFLLLLPFATVMLIHSWGFVSQSFTTGETSSSSQGLPYKFLIKSFLLLAFGSLIASAVARLMRLLAGAGEAPRWDLNIWDEE